MIKSTTVLIVLLIIAGKSRACETMDALRSWSDAGMQYPPDILSRPTSQFSWATPDGLFRIHYDTAGQYAIYRPNEDLHPVDGIPDYVNRVADYLSASYQSLVVGLGFDAPPYDGAEGGDSLYDVYITNVPGLTTPELQSDQYPGRPAYSSYIQVGNDMRNERYPDDPCPFLKATIAHEYFHAVEFAYRAFSSDSYPWWWFESCAQWAQEQVFDDLNDVYYSLEYYLPGMHKSLYLTGGLFIYGAWLFPEYLSENIGPDIIEECWIKFAAFDVALMAVDYALFERGYDMNEQYCRNVVWSYFTGPHYREGFFEEAAFFPFTITESRVHLSYPVDWVAGPEGLENIAAQYIVFRKPDLQKGNLRIEYDNSTDDKQAVCIAVVRQSGSIEYSIYNIENGVIAEFMVPDFYRAEQVVMMPVWLYEGATRQGMTAYFYRACVDTVTAVAEDPSGNRPNDYVLNGTYPNPFNSGVSIFFDSPEEQSFKLNIYDITGRILFTSENQAGDGKNIIDWHPSAEISSGMLFYTINLRDQTLAGKMSFLK